MGYLHTNNLDAWRKDLGTLIEATPNLDWLLLTKRPENAPRLAPWGANPWPRNVWVGCTVEDQEHADIRFPYLMRVPAEVRFLSAEPLLGPLDLGLHRHADAASGQLVCGIGECACGERAYVAAFRRARRSLLAGETPERRAPRRTPAGDVLMERP